MQLLTFFVHSKFQIIRKLMIEMVMSTDMVKHAKFLGEFRGLKNSTYEEVCICGRLLFCFPYTLGVFLKEI